MQFLKDLYDKYKVGSVDFGNDYTQSFGNGQSAMIYAWGHMEGTLKEKYPDIDYGVFAPQPSPKTLRLHTTVTTANPLRASTRTRARSGRPLPRTSSSTCSPTMITFVKRYPN